jgi:TRAP-type transport system periplasmic protein
MRRLLIVMPLCFVLIVALSAIPAADAKSIEWKAASGWPQGVYTRNMHDYFIDLVARESKGELKISLVGPESWPSAEQPAALATGAFDLVFTTAGYYERVVPGVGSTNHAWGSVKEKRAAGLFALFDKTHKPKINARYLLEFLLGPFQTFLSKPVAKLDDWRGLRIRSVPSFHPMISAFGATPIWMPDAEAIDGLRMGVIDGAQTAASQITNLGYHEVTKYVISPPIAFATSNALVNLDSFNKLPKHLQELLERLSLEFEDYAVKTLEEEMALELGKWKAAGLQEVVFSEEDAKRMISATRETYLENMVKPRAPEFMPEVMPILDKLSYAASKR